MCCQCDQCHEVLILGIVDARMIKVIGNGKIRFIVIDAAYKHIDLCAVDSYIANARGRLIQDRIEMWDKHRWVLVSDIIAEKANVKSTVAVQVHGRRVRLNLK